MSKYDGIESHCHQSHSVIRQTGRLYQGKLGPVASYESTDAQLMKHTEISDLGVSQSKISVTDVTAETNVSS